MGLFSDIKDSATNPSKSLKRYFAYRVVYPWELPSIMRKHIYTGAMGNIYALLISGIFFIYFGNAIGLTRFQWGLMGGISSIALSAQLLSARSAQRSGRRKFLWFSTALADRGLRILGIALSFWLWRSGWPYAGLVLIASVCLCNLFGAMAAPPWLSWLADIIPERQHGSFWGRRSAWISLSVLLVMIPAGAVMDRMPEASKPAMALVIFIVAGIVGLADLIIHGTIPEPRVEPSDQPDFLPQILAPVRDRGFRPWLLFNTVWTFAMTLGGALATLYFVEELGIRKNFLGGAVVLTGFALLGSMLTANWSGKVVDRIGPKRVLLGGHLAWALLPAFWFLASPAAALIWLACASIWGGAASTAAVTAANKFMTRFPPPEHRAMYVAVASCLGSLAGGVGILTAGTILKLLADWHWTAGGSTLSAFHLLFALSVALRLASTLLLVPRIRDLEPSGTVN